MSRRVLHTAGGRLASAIAAAVLGAVGLCAPAAHAYVAAQISEEIKPNFGILLRPPLYHHRHTGIWRGRRYGWGGAYEPYGRPYGPPGLPPPYGPGWDGNSITVDCATAPPGSTPISDAAAWVRDGGVVYVRARGVPCTEVIEIDHPVVIAAEEASAFSTETEPQPVVIQPQDGQPCVLIAQGVPNVELRGLRFEAGKAGQASCVESWDERRVECTDQAAGVPKPWRPGSVACREMFKELAVDRLPRGQLNSAPPFPLKSPRPLL